jgi:hypothetical protein
MFRLDDQFLKDIGLDGLPEEQKKPFLQHIYSELELRVGTRLSDGLSDSQLEEFEKIIDRDQEKIQAWIAEHAPNYAQEEAFSKLQQATNLPADDPRLVAEFTATKWLEVNRPDYRQVVAQVLDELKREITTNRDAIMGGIVSESAGQSQPQAPQQPTMPDYPQNSGAQPSGEPGDMPDYPTRAA